MWKITYDGEPVPFDPDPLLLTVPESRLIKARMGNPSITSLLEQVRDMDGDAVLVLWALARARAGSPLDDIEEYAQTFRFLAVDFDIPDDDDEDADPDLPTSPATAG
jgi:hypothetical protein